MMWLEYFKLPKKIWVYFFSLILLSMGGAVIPFLIILLNNEFQFDTAQNGVIFCIIMLSLIPASLLGGKIAGLYNKKYLIVLIRGLYSAILLIYIYINNAYIKLMLLIVSVLLIGLSSPSLNSIAIDFVSKKQRRSAYSFSYIGISIGGVVGPLIIGGLLDNTQNLFIFYSITSTIACVIIGIFIKYEKDELEDDSEGNHCTEKINYGIKIDRVILICILLCFIGFEFSFAQQNFSFPLSLQVMFNRRAEEFYSYVVSYNSALIIIITPLITLITKKVYPISLLICSSILAAIGFGFLFNTSNRLYILILVSIWTIGEILYSVNSFIFLVDLLKGEKKEIASSIILVSRSIGISLCSLTSIYITELISINYIWLFTCTILVLTIGVLCYIKVKLN